MFDACGDNPPTQGISSKNKPESIEKLLNLSQTFDWDNFTHIECIHKSPYRSRSSQR